MVERPQPEPPTAPGDVTRGGLRCRTCAAGVAHTQFLDPRGTCFACWQKRVARFGRPVLPGQPAEGPLARMVCLTLAGLVRQRELRGRGGALAADDRLLFACTDGCTLFELAETLGLDARAVVGLVQANLDRATLELVPDVDLAGGGLAPALAVADLAPALGGERGAMPAPKDSPFRAAPPVVFPYPARSPVPPVEAYKARLARRRRR